MGQSLPLPTNAEPGPQAGSDGVAPMHVTPGSRPRDEVDASAPASATIDATPATGVDAFNAAIVRSKVRMPDLQQYTLERPRLLNWVENHAHRRVRVLAAEAGYGKSTLIVDHARRSGRRMAWLRLESNDVDWVGMLSYLVASLREVMPDFATGAINLLQRVGVLNATRDMVLDLILAELDSIVTEPLTLVLDDFHVVQDGDDVRAIMGRLLELAPPSMNFIIAGHRHPGTLLARPMGQGQVADLSTQDLRFTSAESARLIAELLGGPIDEDLLQILDDRLAGWAASIQLIATSLIGRGPSEVRNAIEDLSSRSEPLYDFLAVQVLARITGSMQRVLWMASLLERVEASLVLAAMGSTSRQAVRRVGHVLKEAEESGVISRTSTAGRWWRFHPLVRDFMTSRLMASTSRQALLGMHLRVAKAAEQLDWAISAHHYIEAEHRADAMRVLRESAIQAVGTARWGAATALVDRMPDQPVPVAVMVIRARHIASQGRAREAVEMLERLTPGWDDPMAWGLVKLALANVHLVLGHLDVVRSLIAEMALFDGLPDVVQALAKGFTVLVEAHDGGNFADVSRVMDDLAADHVRSGLTHFAGVSYHNGAFVAYARGQYDRCVELGTKAIQQFDATPTRFGVESTQTLVAQALLEQGDTLRSKAYLDSIGTSSEYPADAQADWAWIAAATGDSASAWVYIEQAARTAADASTVPSASAYAKYARTLAHIVDGNIDAAQMAVRDADLDSVEPDAAARHAAMEALVALISDDRLAANRLARAGLAVAETQGAQHWVRWLTLLLAVATLDADGFRRSLVTLLANARLSTALLADAITLGLGLLEDVPDEVVEVIKMSPSRWVPALRRVVSGADRAAGLTAAGLLSRFGTIGDVALLSAFERRHIRQSGRRVYSTALARHISPTMVVHDLGRIRIQIGSRSVALSQSRRKAAALLAFLASRPAHSATRDQVLDAIWPHQSPEGAANSLHQTLFFLRRDIDPWFEDGNSVNYVVVEPDVVFLDPHLVQVDGAAFFRQVSAALGSKDVADTVLPIVRDYQAKFALDFEYEDWSIAWRDQLHGLFLDAVEQAADGLLSRGRHRSCAEVIEHALAIDPDAWALEGRLVVALHQSGAVAAASHQHRHFAKAYEADLGEPAPSLAALRQQYLSVAPD